MTAVTVGAPQRSVERGQSVLSSVIEVEGRRHDIYFRAPERALAGGADAFLAVALLPAMRVGAPLHIDGAVSRRILEHMPTFQGLMANWFHDFHEIAIQAGIAAPPPQAQPAGVACFFSGGIDSFYTVLKHQAEITHLVFVHGFDILLGNDVLRSKISLALRQAASELGKPLLEVETNVRSLFDAYADWEYHVHGTALASVALALSGFKKVYIASGHSYIRLVPMGSHPLITPLWSSEQMDLVHDGCEANRWEKFDRIAGQETVQRWLRVCWRNSEGSYNCGVCNKCLLVRALIRAGGMEERFSTFPPLLDLDELRLAARKPEYRLDLTHFLDHLDVSHPDSDIAGILRAELARPLLAESGPPAGDSQAMMKYAAHIETELKSAQERTMRLEIQLERMKHKVALREAQLERLTNSRSWRLTAPLRQSVRLAGRMRSIRPSTIRRDGGET